jgi:hypothetical protein
MGMCGDGTMEDGQTDGYTECWAGGLASGCMYVSELESVEVMLGSISDKRARIFSTANRKFSIHGFPPA